MMTYNTQWGKLLLRKGSPIGCAQGNTKNGLKKIHGDIKVAAA